VDCARPAAEKRYLHLLIVATRENDGNPIKGRVLEALGAKPLPAREFQLKGFERGLVYGPLVGDIDPDNVYYQLALIRERINLLAKETPSSHLVLVYYQGAEVLGAKGHFLRTRSGRVDPNLNLYRVPCGELEAKLADTLGAKVLLLDVQRDGAAKAGDDDRVLHWPANSYVAVMRYAQVGPAGFLPRAGLIRAWEEALAKTKRLKDVEKQVQQLSRVFNRLLQRQRGELLYHPYIPASLEDLMIGP
jgi:hypothetical protein